MNIIYISYPLVDHGAPHQAMSVFYLARNHVPITFIAWGNYTTPKWLTDYVYLKYYLFPKKTLFSALRFLVQIFNFFWREKPDFVYVQGAQHTPFLLCLPWLKGKTCLIYHTQDYLGPGQHWFYEWCERYFAKHADWVICNEPNRARFMASSYRLKQIPEVIRTALPTWWPVPARDEAYRQQLLIDMGITNVNMPQLVVAGGAYSNDRMSPQVLEAMTQLPRNYGLIFTGMDDDKSFTSTCKQMIAKLNLGKRVLLLKSLAYDKLLNLYAACDIGLLLYPNSGIGHFYQAPGRLTEYLRTGLLIVASNFPSLELLMLKYNLGLVANPYDPQSITQAIEALGSIPISQRLEHRKRLIEIANTDLAYESQAIPVLNKIFNS